MGLTLAKLSTRNLDSFTTKKSSSAELSPLSIVVRAPSSNARLFPIDYGVHAKLFEDDE